MILCLSRIILHNSTRLEGTINPPIVTTIALRVGGLSEGVGEGEGVTLTLPGLQMWIRGRLARVRFEVEVGSEYEWEVDAYAYDWEAGISFD